MTEREKIYDTLMDVAPAIFEKYFIPNHCIAATRIGIDALAYFGIVGKPLPVAVSVFNPEYCRMFEAGERDVQKMRDGGAHVVSIDTGNHGDKSYGGHVMIELPDGIMDLNFGQFSRPNKNMTLPKTIAFVNDLDKSEETTYRFNGCAILIKPTDDQVFKRAPDWKRPHKNITGEVIRAMKEKL